MKLTDELVAKIRMALKPVELAPATGNYHNSCDRTCGSSCDNSCCNGCDGSCSTTAGHGGC